MDWVTGMQKAIDYVEDNLSEELDYEKIAAKACVSSFHFQRIFSIMCNYSLGEYIRNRRLTLAGAELNQSSVKVIDVALKYGYESPDSFAKAFTRFHGIAPSAAREHGANLRSFSRLSIKISLEGGNIMDYRIEKKAGFKMIGKSQVFDKSDEFNRNDIPSFWSKCHMDGTVKALYDLARTSKNSGLVFGICCEGDSSNKFPYMIAATYENEEIPIGYSLKEIPEYTWAVFRCVGAMPRAIQNLWHQIYTEFFPTAEYQPAHEIDMEAYYEGDMGDKNYVSEIWIPVEKK
jgi:AraC family transcriptional regulator